MSRLKSAISNNIGLKIFSLSVAVVLWFYIRGELSRMVFEEEMGLKSGGVPYIITAKVLPVVADIRGEIASGYRVSENQISVAPGICNVVGPKRILERIDFVKTVPIDISEYTKTVTVRASLKPPAKGVKVVDKFVTVIVPIEKIERGKTR